MRARGFWHTAVPLTAGLLVGCGGHGGGSGYAAPPPPSPPPAAAKVTFQTPPVKTINFGQAVTLNWTTSNVTSCTGSASSTIGEGFNGNQATSGPVTVAPTGAGSVTFTLTCTGASGNATDTTATITVNQSILQNLGAQISKIVQIGSTSVANETNPYGLAIATFTSGKVTAGDLIACNFNSAADNAANPPVEGDGSTLIALHPTPGATPTLIAQSDSLRGCNALTILADGTIGAAGYTAKALPFVATNGTVTTPIAGDAFTGGPWGAAFVPSKGSIPAALYASTVSGTISRISGNGATVTEIAKGFCGGGTPGSIYGPSGLTYDGSIDTLYIVDTASYSVVAFANVSNIGSDGVIVNGNCPSPLTAPTPEPTFSGPSASSARVIANGAPFVAPLSAALLADGDLIVTNSDINIPASGATPNLAFEISPVLPKGFVGDSLQLDSGASGALFGIVATTDAQGHQIIYFNDDNLNAVEMLSE